tara:strand:+ start:627 stop:971 length:345 start_codon:yes stop_codon:yes gene_type:complete
MTKLSMQQIKNLQTQMRLQKLKKRRDAELIDPAGLNKLIMGRLAKSKKLKRPNVNPLQMAAKGGSMSTKAAFREVNRNEPKAVAKTRKKHGRKRAQKQKIAIALSKAGRSRRRG